MRLFWEHRLYTRPLPLKPINSQLSYTIGLTRFTYRTKYNKIYYGWYMTRKRPSVTSVHSVVRSSTTTKRNVSVLRPGWREAGCTWDTSAFLVAMVAYIARYHDYNQADHGRSSTIVMYSALWKVRSTCHISNNNVAFGITPRIILCGVGHTFTATAQHEKALLC